MELRRVVVADGIGVSVACYKAEQPGGLPVVCIPGLTRNQKDFDDVAPAFARRGRDVYAVSLPGRGLSDRFSEAARYNALSYRDVMLALLDSLGVRRAVLIGTSLGGIVSLLMHAASPARVAGVLLNDVGVRLAPEGIARIVGYVATPRPDAASLDEAAAQIRALNEVAFPNRDEDFWRRFALRTYRGDPDGRWRLDYDPRIGEALLLPPPAPIDLAGAFARLDAPCLLLRGALSDLLTPDIVDEMRALNPAFAYAEIAGVGHAPQLTEPDAAAAIAAFLADVD